MLFLTTFVFTFLIITATLPSAFELYGYWKSDQKYPLNILAFDKDRYRYGKQSFPAKFAKSGESYIVQFLKHSNLQIIPVENDVIKVNFPDPTLPKNIVYTRINEEEATMLMKKR